MEDTKIDAEMERKYRAQPGYLALKRGRMNLNGLSRMELLKYIETAMYCVLPVDMVKRLVNEFVWVCGATKTAHRKHFAAGALRAESPGWLQQAMKLAGYCGVMGGGQLCVRFRADPSELVMNTVECGQARMLEWICSKCDVSWNYGHVRAAARRGRLEILKVIQKRGSEWMHAAYASAAEYGHLDCIRYVHSCGHSMVSTDYTHAIVKRQYAAVRLLHELGCPSSDENLANSLRSVLAPLDMKMLEVLAELKFPTSEEAMILGVHTGNVDVVELLYKMGCPHSTEVSRSTTNLKIIACLHSHRCPMDANAVNYAAYKGSIEAILYLRELGCPWDGRAYTWAMMARRTAVVEYLYSHGCPMNAGVHNYVARELSGNPAAQKLNELMVND